MKRFSISLIVVLMAFELQTLAQAPVISGELRKWHKVTLTFDGPATSETATPNPFTNFRLNVTFTHNSGSPTYVVPGYWAADGDAANTSATNGNKWRVHFTPDKTGTWNYTASFRTGNNISTNTSASAGSPAGFMNGQTGSFNVLATNKTGKDFRATGRARYVGQHYLQYAETGKWMVKGGADAPENTLAYNDFDATPNNGNRRKTWQPHQQDYKASEAAQFTWKSGNGTELLGVVRYLGEIKDVNAMSFLTFSLDGDDDNVYPHRQKQNNASSWNQVDHDRFDVSKMDQWEKIFEYADTKGVFLHFKTHEQENDQLMSELEGKIYYRELVARYGHHLALVWNISEEVTIADNLVKSWMAFLESIDPYNSSRGLHTFPGQKNKYNNYTGDQSEMTYASLQSGISAVHNDVRTWVNNSRNAGKRWIVCNDEQGGANIGVDCDPKDDKKVRQQVVWGTLLAGGMGFEFYYGYQTCQSDLTAQDHRTRDTKYTHAAHALKFFNEYFQPYLPDTRSDDGATSATDDYVLRNAASTAYAIYRPNGGSTAINLPSGSWTVAWYNPRNGVMGPSSNFPGNLVAPGSNDWVALLIKGGAPAPTCTTFRTPEDPANTQAGLTASLYDLGTPNVLPDFDALVPVSSTSSSQFTIPASAPSTGYGLVFEGYIDVPSQGEYTFYSASDDGSRVWIGDTPVVNNDGLHACIEKTGDICLDAGTHAIKVEFFQNQGGQCLTVSWSGPSFGKQEIPAGRLFKLGGSGPGFTPVPGKIEAEDFSAANGIQTEPTTDVGGGQNIGYINNGDWAEYQVDVTSAGTYEVTFRVASDNAGGVITLQKDGSDLGSVNVVNTGGWQNWTDVSTTVDLAAGQQTLRLTFSGGSIFLFNVNYIDFKNSAPSTSTLELSPIHDAYIQGSAGLNNDLIRVEAGNRTGYLMFDLSGVNGTVKGATLEMTVSSDPGSGTIEVDQGDSNNWTESNLSNANKPNSGANLGNVAGTHTLGETLSWSLDASQISGGDNLSLVIRHVSGNDVAFASSENVAPAPKLIVTYEPVATGRIASIDAAKEDVRESFEARVYPNPFVNELNLILPYDHAIEQVFVTDASGRIVFEQPVTPGKINLKVNPGGSLKEGVYFLQLVGPGANRVLKLFKK